MLILYFCLSSAIFSPVLIFYFLSCSEEKNEPIPTARSSKKQTPNIDSFARSAAEQVFPAKSKTVGDKLKEKLGEIRNPTNEDFSDNTV